MESEGSSTTAAKRTTMPTKIYIDNRSGKHRFAAPPLQFNSLIKLYKVSYNYYNFLHTKNK